MVELVIAAFLANVGGHRLAYVKHVVEYCNRQGYRAVVGLPESAAASPEFAEHLSDPFLRFDLVTVEPTYSGLMSLSRHARADVTVATDGDAAIGQLLRAGRWRGHGRLSILVMREAAQSGSALRRAVVSRAKLWSRRVVRLMPNVRVSVLKATHWRGEASEPVTRDPTVLTATASSVAGFSAMAGLDSDRYWFGVVGAISPRKNLPLIADAIRSLGPDVGLLVAGNLTVDARNEVREHLWVEDLELPKLVVIDRLLTDEELDSAIVACNCVVLAHTNEGPSGVLGKAIAANTSIVAAGAESLRRDVAGLGSRAIWVPLERDALVAALSDIRADNTGDVSALVAGPEEFAAGLIQDEDVTRDKHSCLRW